MCPFGPSHVFLEFRPYNSVAVYGPDQINADDDDDDSRSGMLRKSCQNPTKGDRHFKYGLKHRSQLPKAKKEGKRVTRSRHFAFS